MRVADRGFLLGCSLRLQIRLQCFNHLFWRTALESLLLRPPPRSGFLTLRTFSRRRQILTDVIEVAQKASLLPEDLTALQPNPLRPVPNGVNVAIQSPTRLPCAVSQATSCGFDRCEGGSIHRPGAVMGLGRHQLDLLPLSGTFALPFSSLNGADHRSIKIGRASCRERV